jgi:hypothetical protein
VARARRFSAVGVGPLNVGGNGLGGREITASKSSASVEFTSNGLAEEPTCLRDEREALLDAVASVVCREPRRFIVESASLVERRV